MWRSKLSHYAISPKNTLWQRLVKKRLPTGYQLGLTLNKLERDLSPYVCEWGAPGELLVHLQNNLTIQVTEQVKTLFLAFISSSCFSIQGHCSQNIYAHIKGKTRGNFRKKYVHFVSKEQDGKSLIKALDSYSIITQTFEELDFNYCNIKIEKGIWRCDIEPFTASEMVSRIPATRRYLRLTIEQRHRLLSALQLLHQFMHKHIR